MIQEPVAGNEESAQVWPAIGGILTWAYARLAPEKAWPSVLRQSYVAHASAYPSIWYGIWSAPDGLNGPRSAQPGYAWSSIATPMTDFPVMNRNPDAMGLLGLLRVAGLEPGGPATASGGARGGLRIRPVVPGGRFVLDVPLLRLQFDPDAGGAVRLSGEYRAHNDGQLPLRFALPAGAQVMSAEVAGQPVTPAVDAGEAALPLSFARGDRISFELIYR